jgi:RNA:NAD 2'-phosphotransferase (TPT1/KptA family)
VRLVFFLPATLLQDALDAGHKFFLSSNNVLLCEGPLPVQFVEQLQQQELQKIWSSEEPAGE